MKLILRHVVKQTNLLLFAAVLFCTSVFSQYKENFEAFPVRDSFLKFGYVFQSATINNASNTVIGGTHSLRVGPLSNPNGAYHFSTGFLYLNQNSTISFKHRATNNSSSASVKLYLVDTSNKVVDSSVSFSAGPSAKTESVSFNGRTGWFRLRWSWKGNGGSAYGVLDDVSTTIATNSVTGSSTYLADIHSFSRISFKNYGATDSVDMNFIFINRGPDVARNGTSVITIPSGFFKDNIIVHNGNFHSANNRFHFSHLAVGDSATVIIRSRVINYGSFSINTTFSGFQFQADPVTDNNTASASYFGGTVLPVKLISFIAQPKANNQTMLVWKTLQEEKVQRYFIERSKNGTEFSTVGMVSPKGANTENSYQFQDQVGGATSHIYYRLKIVDKDGRITYSAVIKLMNVKSDHLTATPNPFQSQLTIQFHSSKSGTAQVFLRNSAGLQVQQVNMPVQAGNNRLPIAGLHTLHAGIYFLSVQHGSEMHSLQIVKN